MYYVKPVITLEPFCIVTHSYAASFSKEKRVLITLTTFFNSKTKMIYLNPLIAYESKLKIKVMPRFSKLHGRFSKLRFRQQLFTNKDF